MTEIEIHINKYVQNKLTDSEIMDCFDQLDLTKQNEIRDKLSMFIQQTHPTEDLINKAIQFLSIKETMTPVVLFKTQTLNSAINKIDKLPDSKLRKSIIVLFGVFKIADTHRREINCKVGCTHDWHNIDKY